jgi:hypothetical protein
VCARPTPARLAQGALAGLVTFAGSLLLASVVARAARGSRAASWSATTAHGACAGLSALIAAGSAAAGLRFPALVAGLLAIFLLAATAVGALVEARARSRLGACAAFAVLAGCVIGQWMPVGWKL